MAEVVHAARAVHVASDLAKVARCGALIPDGLSWPGLVTRFDLDWPDPAEHEKAIKLITCQGCRAALAQEALESTR